MQTIVQTTHTLPWQEIINKMRITKKVFFTYMYSPIHTWYCLFFDSLHEIILSLREYLRCLRYKLPEIIIFPVFYFIQRNSCTLWTFIRCDCVANTVNEFVYNVIVQCDQSTPYIDWYTIQLILIRVASWMLVWRKKNNNISGDSLGVKV